VRTRSREEERKARSQIEIAQPIGIARFQIRRLHLDPINEFRSSQQAGQCHFDTIVESSFFAGLFVELHQFVHIRDACGTPERSRRKIGDDFSRACALIRGPSRTACKNSPAAWGIVCLFGIVGTFNSDSTDMREICETRSRTGLYRVAHEVLVEVQHRSEVGLQESDAKRMRPGLGRKTYLHPAATAEIQTGLPAAHFLDPTRAAISCRRSPATLPIHK